MGWFRELFIGRHEKYLVAQVEEQKKTFNRQLEIQQADCDEKLEFMRSRYQDEVKYLRDRVRYVEDELERTRLFITPALNATATRAEVAAFEKSEENREAEPAPKSLWTKVQERTRQEDHDARVKRQQDFEVKKLEEQKAKDSQKQPATA